MSRLIHHSPGSFSWLDYAAHDVKKARTFFGELLGWKAVDFEPDGSSAIFRLEGEPVAGLGTIPPSMHKTMPPTWNTYVAVDDIGQTSGWVTGAGGAVIMPQTPVGTAGSMAVFADKSGHPFAVWKAGDHLGAGLIDEPGARAWFELRTADLAVARAFYVEVFGWTMAEGPPGVLEIHHDARAVGAVTLHPAGAAPPGPPWLPSVAVEKLDAALKKVVALGGEVLGPPVKGPRGRTSVISDDQGGVLSLIQLPEV